MTVAAYWRIPVNAGTRFVRVVKEGYAPFEAKPSIAGKSTVQIDARLEQLVRAGKLADVAWRKIGSGDTVSSEELEANYIRRSDAEIFAKNRH